MKKTFFEFRNIPYNSWIPASTFAFAGIALGAVLIHFSSAKLWFVSLVLWILAGVMLAKVKYVRYTFDKIKGTVKITRRGITGTKVKTYALSNIKEIVYEKERDLQGGNDVQLFMKLENGKEVKLLAGHFCGIRAKLKKHLKRKLDVFLKDIPNLRIQVHNQKKKEPKVKIEKQNSSDSFGLSSSNSSDDNDSISTSESASERGSHRIHRHEDHHDGDSEKKKRRRSRNKRSRSHSDTQQVERGRVTQIESKDEVVVPLGEEELF